jgi:hypothetical protein
MMDRREFLTGAAKLIGLALVLPAVKVLETVQAKEQEPSMIDLVDNNVERIWQEHCQYPPKLLSTADINEAFDQLFQHTYNFNKREDEGRIEFYSKSIKIDFSR